MKPETSIAVHVMCLAAGLLLSTAAFFIIYAMARAPSGEPTRLGLRGLKRQRALAENAIFAQVEPLMRWLGRRARGLISEEQGAALDRRITLAGDYLGLVPEELIGLAVITACFGALVGAFFGKFSGMGNVVIVAGFGFGAIWPSTNLDNIIEERSLAIGQRLPPVIDLLSLAVGAGLDFPGSIRQVVEKASSATDPVVEEFTLVLQSLQLGRSRRQALEDFCARTTCRAVIDFVGAVVQAELRGTPIATVLMIQADVSRQKRSANAEQAASKASVKLVAPLALILLAVLFLVISPMVLRLRGGG